MNNQNFFGTTKHIHFIGIGGHGVSAVARAVLLLGYKVTGSDHNNTDYVKNLVKMGLQIQCGEHKKSNISESVDAVVKSTAISDDNPEVVEAKKRGIPVISRGEMLAEIMRMSKKGIAVTGTHGKTTTTAMISSIFNDACLEPTTILGGQSFGLNTNAQVGSGEYMISEADESDGSFLKLSPTYTVVTNIDWDHMNFYKSKENLVKNFIHFINKTPFYGMNILCFDDENIASLVEKIEKPFIGYALDDAENKNLLNNEKIQLVAKNVEYKAIYSEYDLFINGKLASHIKINIAGRHNVLNSLAAIGLSLQVGISLQNIAQSLEKFQGVYRRMSRLGMWRGFELIDDYGHHPNELRATLNTIKRHYQEIVVVFQPHRFSRTLEHYQGLAQALTIADRIYLTPIYSAGEDPIENVTADLVFHELNKIKSLHQKVVIGESLDHLYQIILDEEKQAQHENSCIISMGAGDIYKLSRKIHQNNSPQEQESLVI